MNKKLIISYQKEWDENGTIYRQTVKIPMKLFNHINAKLKEAIKDKKHSTITNNFKHVYIKTLHKGKNYTTITTSGIVRYELEQLGADISRYLTERNTIIEAY